MERGQDLREVGTGLTVAELPRREPGRIADLATDQLAATAQTVHGLRCPEAEETLNVGRGEAGLDEPLASVITSWAVQRNGCAVGIGPSSGGGSLDQLEERTGEPRISRGTAFCWRDRLGGCGRGHGGTVAVNRNNRNRTGHSCASGHRGAEGVTARWPRPSRCPRGTGAGCPRACGSGRSAGQGGCGSHGCGRRGLG